MNSLATLKSAPVCPVCAVAPAPGRTECPDCGEDLAPLMWLQSQRALLFNEGLRLAKLGQDDAAIRLLEEACAFSSQSGDALVVLGKLYVRKGRLNEARRVWEKCLALEPDHAGASRALAQLDKLEAATARPSRRSRVWARLKRPFRRRGPRTSVDTPPPSS